MKKHDGCVGCRYEKDEQESKNCIGCKQNAIDKYTRMTNADKIRSMSDEELAEFICNKCDGFCSELKNKKRRKEFVKWLKSEVSK